MAMSSTSATAKKNLLFRLPVQFSFSGSHSFEFEMNRFAGGSLIAIKDGTFAIMSGFSALKRKSYSPTGQSSFSSSPRTLPPPLPPPPLSGCLLDRFLTEPKLQSL